VSDKVQLLVRFDPSGVARCSKNLSSWSLCRAVRSSPRVEVPPTGKALRGIEELHRSSKRRMGHPVDDHMGPLSCAVIIAIAFVARALHLEWRLTGTTQSPSPAIQAAVFLFRSSMFILFRAYFHHNVTTATLQPTAFFADRCEH